MAEAHIGTVATTGPNAGRSRWGVLPVVLLAWGRRHAKKSILIVFALASLAIASMPDLATNFEAMLRRATIGKQNTMSGIQRAFWARTGWDAFVESFGLGIGPGSFRSSSFVTAMLGSVGVIGTIFFVSYFLRVWKPGRASTYMPASDPRIGVGVAASWAALAALIPAALIAAGPDPGTDFAIFAGIALSLRRQPRAVPGAAAKASGPNPRTRGHEPFAGPAHPRPAGSAARAPDLSLAKERR